MAGLCASVLCGGQSANSLMLRYSTLKKQRENVMVLIHSVSLILYTQYNVDIAKMTLEDDVIASRLKLYNSSTDEYIYVVTRLGYGVQQKSVQSCVHHLLLVMLRVAVEPLKTT